MEPNETKALIQICRLRFRSFSDAVEAALGALTDVVPGQIVLSRAEPETRECRVIGTAGEGVGGLTTGSVLPLEDDRPGQSFLSRLGIEDQAAIPLELGDGRLVGTLSALSSTPGTYGTEHFAMLGIVARLLSFEWENVEVRAEMQRLRGRLPEHPGVDSATGLPNREGFMGLLEREWHLAKRGTVESTLVLLRVAGSPDFSANGSAASFDVGGPQDRLALKIAAETLEGSARNTDRIGRTGEQTLAVALIGCRPAQAAAFVGRYLGAIERVSRSGEPRIRVSHGIVGLAEASSPQQAIDLADTAAGEPVEPWSAAGAADPVEGRPEARP